MILSILFSKGRPMLANGVIDVDVAGREHEAVRVIKVK